MGSLQLAAAELGRDVAAQPDTDAITRQDARRAGDIALLGRFSLLRLVDMTLRGQFRSLRGGRAEKSGHQDECDPSLRDHEPPSGLPHAALWPNCSRMNAHRRHIGPLWGAR